MFLLAIGASVLTLYAGRLCCRATWHRVVFTLVVMAALTLEASVLLPGETGVGSHGSPATVYGSSALLIVAGALTLARIAPQNGHHQPPWVPPVAPQNNTSASPSGNSGVGRPSVR